MRKSFSILLTVCICLIGCSNSITSSENGSGNTLEVRFHLEEYSEVRVHVENSQMILVKVLCVSYMSSGTYSLQWNGIDYNGNEVPTGIYNFVVTVGNKKFRKEVVYEK